MAVPQAKVREKASEAELEAYLVAVARMRGWDRQYHTKYSIGSTPGWPDWVWVHPAGDIVIAELKGFRGKASDDQLEWLHALRQLGLPVYLWYPKHAQEATERLWTPRPGRWQTG